MMKMENKTKNNNEKISAFSNKVVEPNSTTEVEPITQHSLNKGVPDFHHLDDIYAIVRSWFYTPQHHQ